MMRFLGGNSAGACVVAAGLLLGGPAFAAERIVSAGSDVTEIVYALGQGGNLVCVDQTSQYPAEAQALPQLGYVRNLAAEGVLSCRPDIIVTAADAGPPAVIAQLRDAGIAVVSVEEDHSFEGALGKIETVAAALGVTERGDALIAELREAMATHQAALDTLRGEPRVLFLLSQTPNAVMAAGAGTAADAMLGLADAENVASGFEGYKQLTAESAAALSPDYILVANFSVEMLGGLESILARPEIALTPAGQNHRVMSIDALLMLGFGPRIPEAVGAIAEAVHPEFEAAYARVSAE
jgi:iron complex transport system substrate-binding protein